MLRTRTARQRKEINDFLGRRGLATLDDPRGMCQHLGFLVRDHAHFRSLLTRCEPEHRREMYEALRPHLRFEAQPLDVYLAEAGRQAEVEQLPTVDAQGNFHPFQPAELRSLEEETPVNHVEAPAPPSADLATAQGAVNEHFAKKKLWLVCAKCTKEAVFTGDTKSDCWFHARAAGWHYQHVNGEPANVCPDCPQELS